MEGTWMRGRLGQLAGAEVAEAEVAEAEVAEAELAGLAGVEGQHRSQSQRRLLGITCGGYGDRGVMYWYLRIFEF